MLRVVAAVNNKTPLPGWNDNGELTRMLKKALDHAISVDPGHYKELVERSKNWDNGIR